jgi:hypothetical protein
MLQAASICPENRDEFNTGIWNSLELPINERVAKFIGNNEQGCPYFVPYGEPILEDLSPMRILDF